MNEHPSFQTLLRQSLSHRVPALQKIARLLLALVILAGLAGCQAGTPVAPTPQPAAATPTQPGAPALEPNRLVVRADNHMEAGAFERGRLLNVAIGSNPARVHSAWLPGAYDALLEAGIRRVRLDHITDDAYYRVVWRNKEGQLTFDFSRLDAALLPLLERGIQPFLCLSYSPAVLTPDGSLQTLPNLSEWQQVVSAIARHYLEAGYSGLYWEVWSAPDLEQSLRADTAQYISLYRVTALALRQIDPRARVGGPSDSAPAAANGRLNALLAAAAVDPDMPLDFISYHKSADSNADGLPPFDLEWGYDIVDFTLRRSQLPPREIYVTSWNLTGSAGSLPEASLVASQPVGPVDQINGVNDSHQGASEAAVMLYNSLKYEGLSGMFYAPLLDGVHEDGIFHNGPGLLTVNYHRKALFQLFQMISWMGEDRLATEVSGDETRRAARYALVTRADDGQVAVLAWNNTPEDVTIDLAVDGLPASGNWQAVRYQIDDAHGGYLSDYQAGLRGLSPSPSETLLPVEHSTLPVTPRFERVTRLPAYSVVLFLLAPPDSELPGWAAPAGPSRNLAAGKPVIVSSSRDAPGWRPEAAVDEILLSLPGLLGWSSAKVDKELSLEWITVDLQQAALVRQVVLVPRNDENTTASLAPGGGFPVDFRIQGALTANQWSDLGVYSGYNQPNEAQVFDLAPGSYRYIRVMASRLGQIAGRPGEFYFQIAELQVFGE